MKLFEKEDHFNSKKITYEIDSNGCWNCTSHVPNRDGYPRIMFKGKRMYIHRYMYLTNVGKISTGLVVRHKCDNPNCINPEHLEIGTQADNIQDMVDRGRQATNIGEKNPKARLSTKNVIDIRKRFQNGERQIEIAKRYGITRHHVWDVINRKWKHINENALSKEAIKEIMKDKNTGENNPNAKLSVSDVIDIRNRYQNGEKQANIAQNYGCSKALISSVIRRKIWKQLPMEVPC